jgi:hypothetical protein
MEASSLSPKRLRFQKGRSPGSNASPYPPSAVSRVLSSQRTNPQVRSPTGLSLECTPMDMSKLPPRPTFRAFGTGQEDPALIARDEEVRYCYEHLFPVGEEREQYDNIIKWLCKGHSNPKAKWVELFLTMHLDGVCVGMTFLSGFRPLRWWFGNYFGVKKAARVQSKAVAFWEEQIATRCMEIMPRARGLIFETERFQDQDIEAALAKLESRKAGMSVELTSKENFSVTAVARIAGYTSYGISHRSRGVHMTMITDGKEYRPVDYVQPAMQLPLGQSNEVPLWLMILPFRSMIGKRIPDGGYEITPEETEVILDFLYGHVFPSAYSEQYVYMDGTEDNERPSLEGYAEYLNEVRGRVTAGLAGNRVVLKNRGILPPTTGRLFRLHGKEEL